MLIHPVQLNVLTSEPIYNIYAAFTSLYPKAFVWTLW